MIPLIVGTLLAIGALAFVLWPLFDEGTETMARVAPRAARGEDAIEALREIEFDRATGKLSDTDYASLKSTYTTAALAQLRASDAAAGPATASDPAEDAAEAAVRRWRLRATSCAECGPRPEPDAIYCSSCGRHLDGRCGRCGAEVTETGAAFCVGCGDRLAA